MIGDLSRYRPSASLAGIAVGVASALVQLGPLLGRGYVLSRDMVFTPHPPLDAHVLGLDAVPRGVPSDLLVALATRVLPGDVVQDLILLAIIAFAGWGAARLVDRLGAGTGATGRLAPAVSAAALYSWNPYLAERLRQGQWAVLVGYAALPWVAATATALHRGERRAGRHLFLALAIAAAGGASAELLAVPVAVPVAWWPGSVVGWWRRIAVVTGSFVLVSLPWAVPGVISPASYPPDRAGVLAFAARADTPFGTAGSLLGLGGMWNSAVAMPGHGTFAVSAVAILATLLSLWAYARARPAGPWAGLALGGIVGFALAIWAAVPGVRRLAVDVGSSSSAGGLLRDGQRWLAPFVLLVAIGFGALVGWGTRQVRVAPALALVPILLLPAAAWGSDGALAAVHWPADWGRVASATGQLPPGPVLVLPWSSQRQYGWNADRTLAEPAADWLSRRVVGDDSLVVGDRSTPLEDPLARRIAPAVTGSSPLLGPLARQGYAGVLLEADQTAASTDAARLAGLRPVLRTATLTLYAVPKPAPPAGELAARGPVLAADVLAALAVLACLVSLVEFTTRRRRTV